MGNIIEDNKCVTVKFSSSNGIWQEQDPLDPKVRYNVGMPKIFILLDKISI
jgi:hypothetical protein